MATSPRSRSHRASLAALICLLLADGLLAQEAGPARPGATAQAASQPRSETWVGHQVVTGTRPIPVIGELETRSESFLLAEVRQEGEDLVIEQRACRFGFKKVLGVAVDMSARTVARLPRATMRFRPVGDGVYRARPWTVSWGQEDIDGDGHPGATVQVSSALCSGTVYTTSRTVSQAEGARTEDGLYGTVEVMSREDVIDSSEWCLGSASKGKEEQQRGWFRYRRVEPGTTCAALAGKPWPVRAQTPRKSN